MDLAGAHQAWVVTKHDRVGYQQRGNSDWKGAQSNNHLLVLTFLFLLVMNDEHHLYNEDHEDYEHEKDISAKASGVCHAYSLKTQA